jgi:hypothetical protein
MLFFDNHGVTHPTREWRSPCLTGSVKEQHALADPESAAQALMGSGLIEVDNIPFEKPGELFLMENQEMIQACSPHA